MSAIGAIAGSLSQFIQSLNPSGAASGTSNSSSGALTGSSGHHHHHGGGGFSKLADAVTSALESASNSSSGSTTTDPNQTITQALTKIFENGSLGSTGTADSDSDADGTQAADSSDPSTASTNGLPASFVQTLKSFGVTAQQFQTDLSSALQTAQQSGTVDASNLFKNFPPGSLVDALG